MDVNERFAYVTEYDRSRIIENAIPDNTRKRNIWSFKIFQQLLEWKKTKWATERGLMVLKGFEEYDVSDLNFLLEDFAMSVRKEDKAMAYRPTIKETRKI